MPSHPIRDGKGHRAYRRKRDALKRQAQRDNQPCSWCGGEIDYNAPYTHPKSFTADHPVAIANGGSLLGQELAVMCKSCNSRKNNHAVTEIWNAS